MQDLFNPNARKILLENYCLGKTDLGFVSEPVPDGLTHLARFSVDKFVFGDWPFVFLQCEVRSCRTRPCGNCKFGDFDSTRRRTSVGMFSQVINYSEEVDTRRQHLPQKWRHHSSTSPFKRGEKNSEDLDLDRRRTQVNSEDLDRLKDLSAAITKGTFQQVEIGPGTSNIVRIQLNPNYLSGENKNPNRKLLRRVSIPQGSTLSARGSLLSAGAGAGGMSHPSHIVWALASDSSDPALQGLAAARKKDAVRFFGSLVIEAVAGGGAAWAVSNKRVLQTALRRVLDTRPDERVLVLAISQGIGEQGEVSLRGRGEDRERRRLLSGLSRPGIGSAPAQGSGSQDREHEGRRLAATFLSSVKVDFEVASGTDSRVVILEGLLSALAARSPKLTQAFVDEIDSELIQLQLKQVNSC